MTVAGSVGEFITAGPMLLAVLVAIAAGLVSFLSPCCLPLLPGYLAYVSGSAGADAHHFVSGGTDVGAVAVRPRVGRTVYGTVLFVLGFAAVFTSYGAAFGVVGSVLLTHQDAVYRVLGALTIVMGLMFAGAFSRFRLGGRTLRLGYRPRVGVAGAPLLGGMFGVGWTPCIGPTLAAVLSLSATAGGAGRGALLSFAYSLGLGLPFIVAALGIERAFAAFRLARTHARLVMRVGGAMLIVVGVFQVTGAWADLMVRTQVLVAGWSPAL
jgi:cytochrome c-type biogenesis protein